MDIFVDGAGKSGQDNGPSEWAELGTRDARRKENTIESTPWKGETMPQKGAAPRTPKPEVFKDVVSHALSPSSLLTSTDKSGIQPGSCPICRGGVVQAQTAHRGRTPPSRSTTSLRYCQPINRNPYHPSSSTFAQTPQIKVRYHQSIRAARMGISDGWSSDHRRQGQEGEKDV